MKTKGLYQENIYNTQIVIGYLSFFWVSILICVCLSSRVVKKDITLQKNYYYWENKLLKSVIMAKSMDTKKTEKKEPLKTPKEKKAEKREKKANKK
jgi:hypothetical protein